MFEPAHDDASTGAQSGTSEFRQGAVKYLLINGFYRLAYVEWGDPDAPAVLCVHGLTRTGRDFDPLARVLSKRYRVICPDLPGRAKSDWLPSGALYQPTSYVQALSHLLAVIDKPVRWVGTSLGGICGMAVAATPGNPITHLVLNDIGPLIALPGLQRIHTYMAGADLALTFPDMAALEAHLRRIHAPFGPMTDAQWADLARTSARTLPDGTLALHYDPKIAEPIAATEPKEIDMWPYWNAIRAPVMTIRGETSDLLLPETLDRMVADGSQALVIPGVGHAPSLMDTPTIHAIEAFLTDETQPGLKPVPPPAPEAPPAA